MSNLELVIKFLSYHPQMLPVLIAKRIVQVQSYVVYVFLRAVCLWIGFLQKRKQSYFLKTKIPLYSESYNRSVSVVGRLCYSQISIHFSLAECVCLQF